MSTKSMAHTETTGEPCRFCKIDHDEKHQPTDPGLQAWHSFARMMQWQGIHVQLLDTEITPENEAMLRKLGDLIYWENRPDLAEEWRSKLTIIGPGDLFRRAEQS